MDIRSNDSLLWSCAPDAPALSRCHLAVRKPTRIDWLCWNGIVVVVVVVVEEEEEVLLLLPAVVAVVEVLIAAAVAEPQSQ